MKTSSVSDSMLVSYQQRIGQINARLLELGRKRHYGQISAEDYWNEVSAMMEFVDALTRRRAQ